MTSFRLDHTPNPSPHPRSAPRLIIVVKGYPRLSETFIAQELAGLEARGLPFIIVSLRHPTDKARHPLNDAITAPVVYLPEYLHQEPLRVFAAWRRARHLPGYGAAKALWMKDLKRDLSRNRIRRFGQALVLAAEMADFGTIDHIYVHFLHTPASVARYAAKIRHLPWSVSAHAKDIWTTPAWEKQEKLAEMSWLVTCTAAGYRHLRDLAPPDRQERISLLYHGLDFSRFPPPPDRPFRDGTDPENPVEILSVGRLVAKKGYDDILVALAQLPPALAWRFTHIGGGNLRKTLRKTAEKLGIAARITWRGAQAADQVLAALRTADLFVLAPKVAKDGDRDGLPNVLLEAASQGLACLSTDAVGVPELITDQVTGYLVPPSQPQALRDALIQLIGDPNLRHRLGQAANHHVRTAFTANAGLDMLVHKLAPSIAPTSVQKKR